MIWSGIICNHYFRCLASWVARVWARGTVSWRKTMISPRWQLATYRGLMWVSSFMICYHTIYRYHINHMTYYIIVHGQEWGGGSLADFLRVIVFCSFTSSPVGWRHVRSVGAWVTGASRAQTWTKKAQISNEKRDKTIHMSETRRHRLNRTRRDTIIVSDAITTVVTRCCSC